MRGHAVRDRKMEVAVPVKADREVRGRATGANVGLHLVREHPTRRVDHVHAGGPQLLRLYGRAGELVRRDPVGLHEVHEHLEPELASGRDGRPRLLDLIRVVADAHEVEARLGRAAQVLFGSDAGDEERADATVRDTRAGALDHLRVARSGPSLARLARAQTEAVADLDVAEAGVLQKARDESGVGRGELEVDRITAVADRAVEDDRALHFRVP
jgi:hypothetical protein